VSSHGYCGEICTDWHSRTAGILIFLHFACGLFVRREPQSYHSKKQNSPFPSRATKSGSGPVQRSLRGAAKANQRASYARCPLAASAVSTTHPYHITSDNTEKVKNVCNKVGPQAPGPLPDCWAPVICSGFPHISLTLFPRKGFFFRLKRVLVLSLVDVTEVIFKAKIIPVGRAPPVEKHRKPTTGNILRAVQWRIMPESLW